MRGGRGRQGGWRSTVGRFFRWVAGDIVASNTPPVFTATTTVTVEFNLGVANTANIASYVTDADSNPITFSTNDVTLPTGVTFGTDGTFTYDGTGSTPASTTGLIIYANDGVSDVLTNFMLSSSLGGVVAFRFGQVYAQGAVPAGQTVLALGTDGFQTDIKNRWPDGSALFAVHSGRVSVSTGALVSIALRPATSVSLAPLTETNLTSISPVVCVAMGGYGDVVLSNLIGVSSTGVRGSNGRVRTWISGPEYSEWHYQALVTTTDPQLTCWIYAGLHRDNSLWLRVITENGYWQVSAPGERQYRYTIKAAGSVVYDQWMHTSEVTSPSYVSAAGLETNIYLINETTWVKNQRVLAFAASAGTSVFGTLTTVSPYDSSTGRTSVGIAWDSGSLPTSIQAVRTLGHPHHTRWGKDFWYSPDPRVTHKHDVSAAKATKLFANYAYPSASAGNFTSMNITNPGPFIKGAFQDLMGDTGAQTVIGLLPEQDAFYLAAGDPRALKCAIAHSEGHGRYPIHYRDETNLKPVRINAYSSMGIRDQGNLTGSGVFICTSATPSVSGTSFPPSMIWEGAHHPAIGYLPYLMTGDYYHMEEAQYLAHFCVRLLNDVTRQGAQPRLYNGGQARFLAWAYRSLAYAARVTPDDDILQTDYVSCLTHSVRNEYSFWVSGSGTNTLGVFARSPFSYDFVTSVYEDAPWQMDFNVAVQGVISELGLPFETSVSGLQTALRNFGYKHVVGRFGLGGAEYCYRKAGQYTLGYGTPEETGGVPTNWFTWGQVYQTAFTSVTCVRGEPLLDSYVGDFNGAFQMGYWGNLMPALSYAVEHQASGAVSAWSLLTSASNWPVESALFNQFPCWAVKPRGF